MKRSVAGLLLMVSVVLFAAGCSRTTQESVKRDVNTNARKVDNAFD